MRNAHDVYVKTTEDPPEENVSGGQNHQAGPRHPAVGTQMRRSRSEVSQSIGSKAHGESWQGVESHSTTCAAYIDIFVHMITTRMSSCTYH